MGAWAPGLVEVDSGARIWWQVASFETGAELTLDVVWRDRSGNRMRTSKRYTTASAALATGGILTVGPGWLERVTVRASDSGTTQRSQWTRVIVGPFDGGQVAPELVLLEGMIGSSGLISWPGLGPRDVMADGWFPFVINVTQPAAGAQWTYTFSGFGAVQLQTVVGKFAADANVATRIPMVSLFLGSNRIVRSPIGQGISATATKFCSWSIRTGTSISNGSQVAGPLVFETVLNGYKVESEVENMQSGDQWTDVYLIGRARMNV